MAIGKDLFLLYDVIGYKFRDVAYLENALTHSSFANERKSKGISYPSNERLEFLGDAVLQITISEYLYKQFKKYSEGTLTKIRQYLVCEKTLAAVAREIDLGQYLHVGRGEELTDCRNRPKVLADTLEALVGAIYLDQEKRFSHCSKMRLKNRKICRAATIKRCFSSLLKRTVLRFLSIMFSQKTVPIIKRFLP